MCCWEREAQNEQAIHKNTEQMGKSGIWEQKSAEQMINKNKQKANY